MLRTKNKAAFDQLYEEHVRLVRNVLFNLVGEGPLDDLTQEAFLRIWKGIPAFGFRSSTKTWVYRITVNTAMDYFRKKSIRTEELREAAMLTAIPESAVTNGNQQAVHLALMELPEEHRAVAVLFYFEELSLQDIAKVLNVAVGTVKSRLHTARERLRVSLKKQGMTDVA